MIRGEEEMGEDMIRGQKCVGDVCVWGGGGRNSKYSSLGP